MSADLLSKKKKVTMEKLGSDISSSEDELITGGSKRTKTPKSKDGRMSPVVTGMRKIGFREDSTSDTNFGNGDKNMDDDQVCSFEMC